MEEDKMATIGHLLEEQTHETAGRLDSVRLSVDEVAKLPELVGFLESDKPKFQDDKLLGLLQNFGLGRQYASLYIMDVTGLTLVSTDPAFVGSDFSFRRYFRSARDGVATSEIAIGSISRVLGFYFSAPIKNQVGSVVGVVVAKLDPANLFEDLSVSKIRDYGHLMLVNNDGVVIYSSKQGFEYKSLAELPATVSASIKTDNRYPGVVVSSLDYHESLQYVLDMKTSVKVYSLTDEVDNERELVAIKAIGDHPYYLMSEANEDSILATIAGIATVLTEIMLIFLLFVILVQIGFLGWLLLPLEKLEKYAADVSSGNLDKDISVNTGDELESLSNSIRGMVGSIRKLYSGLEAEVESKTAKLTSTLDLMQQKNQDLEDSKKAIVNVMEDLNEEKEKIAAEKNRIETILRSIGDGVFVTDEFGLIKMVNHAAEKMCGFSSMEMYDKKYSEVFNFVIEDDEATQYPDFVGDAIASGAVGSLLPHTVLVAKDGTRVPVLDSAAPLRSIVDNKVFGCVVVLRDNTKERELEKSKDDFLSVASHQLRTPLGSMRWNLEMLLGGDAGDIGAEALEITKQIYDGNQRMIGLVNDLLNVSRIDQGRVMDSPEVTDIRGVIDEVLKEVEPLTVEKNIKILTNLVDRNEVLKIDKNRFREVIENLVSNAIKYNKPSGEVKIELNSDKESINISISDSGIGVPKKDFARLFDRFFRAENAVHSETEGSGLGLYVAKKFVEGWGGQVHVTSEPGQGSKFTISLPVTIRYRMENI